MNSHAQPSLLAVGSTSRLGYLGAGILSVFLAACTPTPSASQKNLIKMDGSNTIYPLAEALAEDFQKVSGHPVAVGSSGTSGGLNKLCRGDIDIATASRPISQLEMAECAKQDIAYIELPIAMDAIAVVVNPKNTWISCVSTQQLKQIWQRRSQSVLNNWQQIDATFPSRRLHLYGAGVSSGTYDYFTAAIIGKRHASRGDYSATEDDNISVRGVSGDVNALAFLGLNYYLENQHHLKALSVLQPDGQCIAPGIESARDGLYKPLSRGLFIYVNQSSLQHKPALQQFLQRIFNPEINHDLSRGMGFVPLSDKVLQRAQHKLSMQQAGSDYAGDIQQEIKQGLLSESQVSDVMVHASAVPVRALVKQDKAILPNQVSGRAF